ncbi:MAG: hypothetical protein KDK70_26670 [Myxococcales bacterium]|nr:hypothetical protein [Myxococcales bacterium]
MLLGACFDSDEKLVPLDPTTSTSGPSTGTSTSTTTSDSSSTTAEPEQTCRDAIDCVVGCAGELQMQQSAELDLTCFLTCEDGLTVAETLHLFRLTECVTNKCISQGVCDFLVPTESSSSGSSSGGESSSSGTGTDTTDGTRPNLCLQCVLTNILDEQLGGECQTLADMCM